MTSLSVTPAEGGTAIITLYFKDEDGVDVVPTTAAWQLMKNSGEIINNRSFENSPIIGTKVVLTGDDLIIDGIRDSGKRIFAIQTTYNSDSGDGLHLNDEIQFSIRKLISQ